MSETLETVNTTNNTETIEKFKTLFLSRMIKQMIATGYPPERFWKVHHDFLLNPTIMEALFSEKGYKLYLSLDKEGQLQIIDFVENCGSYISSIIGCPVLEEWNSEPIVISEEKLIELRDKYNISL